MGYGVGIRPHTKCTDMKLVQFRDCFQELLSAGTKLGVVPLGGVLTPQLEVVYVLERNRIRLETVDLDQIAYKLINLS